jgi:hypothetical protein
MTQSTRRRAAAWFAALAVACVALSSWSAEPLGEAQKIRIENFSGLRGIQEYIHKNAPAELRNTLLKGQHAVFVSVTTFEGSKVPPICLAMVGLTHPENGARNPRIPAVRYIGVLEKSSPTRLTQAARDSCKLAALRSALHAMWKDPLPTILQDFEKTATSALPNDEPENGKSLPLWWDRNKANALVARATAVVPPSLIQAFYNRKLQLAIFSGVIDMNDQLLCYAIVGLTARSADYLQPRYPESTYSRLEALAKPEVATTRAQNECAASMVRSALQHMVADYTATRVSSISPSIPLREQSEWRRSVDGSMRPSLPNRSLSAGG